MDLLELLQRARSRIADPHNWTQQALARTGVATPCNPTAKAARSWCLMGSLMWASGGESRLIWEAVKELTAEIETEERDLDVGQFNDQHGHARILDLLDQTIARIQATDL